MRRWNPSIQVDCRARNISQLPYDQHQIEPRLVHDLTVLIPSAHAEADIQQWPLPRLRRQIILLVGVWNQSIVGGHHSDIEMYKVLEKGRFVGAWIARRHYEPM